MDLRTANRLPAPCVNACPARIDIPRYIGYIERGQFAEAAAVVRESIPLPMVCGLICYRPCEPWCRRGIMEAPVAINAIKRAAAEHDASRIWRARWPATVGPPTGKRVAVVGSGPAGLTATYYLARCRGHQVTLFEALPDLGGQLRYGLPDYKVPRERLQHEVALITETRVEVRRGERVRSLAALAAQFDAVVLAIGQGRPAPLGIRGERLAGVEQAAGFLRKVNEGWHGPVGRRVVVFGGNNLALDAARCALRLGAAEVAVMVPGTRADARAYDFEFRDAEEEGVRIEELRAPRRIERGGGALLAQVQKLRVTATDDWGRATLAPEDGGPSALAFDTILLSPSRRADAPRPWGLALTPAGTLAVGEETAMTSRPGVFAAGEAVTGPDSIVEAMAQGKKAASAVDRHLGGDGDLSETFAPEPGPEMSMPPHLAQQGKPPVSMPRIPAGQRRYTFQLVEAGYSREQAVAEARRCVRCDLWRQGAPEVWSKQRG